MSGKNKQLHFQNTDTLLDQYRLHLEILNRSSKTITWYLDILRRFFKFLMEEFRFESLDNIGVKHAEAYIAYRKKSKKWENKPNIRQELKTALSPFSIQGDVGAIKAFWSWLLKQGLIASNPFAGFPLPNVPKNKVKILSLDQLKRLFAAIDKTTSVGFRIYCILLLFIGTGMRISETVGILVSNLNLQECLVLVAGKGEKQRFVPFPPLVRKTLISYLKHHRPILCESNSVYLFPAKDGNHVSVNSVQQYIRRLAVAAGLDGVRCHPHIFRHSFGTMFIAKGGSELVLKEIMGHESLATTQKYTHFQPQDLRKQQWKFSPLEDLFGKG